MESYEFKGSPLRVNPDRLFKSTTLKPDAVLYFSSCQTFSWQGPLYWHKLDHGRFGPRVPYPKFLLDLFMVINIPESRPYRTATGLQAGAWCFSVALLVSAAFGMSASPSHSTFQGCVNCCQAKVQGCCWSLRRLNLMPNLVTRPNTQWISRLNGGGKNNLLHDISLYWSCLGSISYRS